MRFSIEQHFAASPDAVLQAYTDPSLYAGLHGMRHISAPEVLEVRTDDHTTLVRARYRFIASLPSAAKRVIDPARLTWIDETTYDSSTRRSRTVLMPDHYGDRFEGSATSSYEADGASTVRRISGLVEVRMPLVGGRVESTIVDGLREHLADEAAAVNRHLDT